jgi:hypothetical protein
MGSAKSERPAAIFPVFFHFFFNADQALRRCLLVEHCALPVKSSESDILGDAKAPHLGLSEFGHR